MELGCLAAIGAFLLLIGAAILTFERVRHRRDNSAYTFPDLTTALIEDEQDPDKTPVRPRPALVSLKPQVQSLNSQVSSLKSHISGLRQGVQSLRSKA